jgi:hypothetical protein
MSKRDKKGFHKAKVKVLTAQYKNTRLVYACRSIYYITWGKLDMLIALRGSSNYDTKGVRKMGMQSFDMYFS